MRRNRFALLAIAIMGVDLGQPAPKKVDPPEGETFHGHLDKCPQCERNPFGLCPIGAALLEREAKAAPT